MLDDVSPDCAEYYRDLTDLLKLDDSLDKLLQIVFGPVFKATRDDAEDLVRYGVLWMVEGAFDTPFFHNALQPAKGRYDAPFSRHFLEYLRIVERSVDFWLLWRETEVALRALIHDVMTTEYGTTDWVPKLKKARPKLVGMLQQCRLAQEKEMRQFGARASVSLLDFSYPNDLYHIICSHLQSLWVNPESQ